MPTETVLNQLQPLMPLECRRKLQLPACLRVFKARRTNHTASTQHPQAPTARSATLSTSLVRTNEAFFQSPGLAIFSGAQGRCAVNGPAAEAHGDLSDGASEVWVHVQFRVWGFLRTPVSGGWGSGACQRGPLDTIWVICLGLLGLLGCVICCEHFQA